MRPPFVPLSAVIVAANEAARVGAAVASVLPWVDEVLVVDGGSRDDTADVARAAGARVLSHPWEGYVAQKQWGADHAAHHWIVSLDADERVDETLGAALGGAAAAMNSVGESGARVRRVNFLDGRPIRATGWGRDLHVRLFDRRRARWGGVDPHDRVVGARGPVLPGVLHHDPDRSTRAYVRGTVRHARTKAAGIAAGGRPAPWAPALHGVAHWARKAVTAPLDGRRGWTIAWVGAKGTARAYRLARRVQ